MKRIFLGLILSLAFESHAHAVIGGQTAPEFEHHTIMVLSKKGSMCSGAVISQTTILTAAHCVSDGSDYAVHFRNPAGEPVLLIPKSILVHPNYVRDAIAKRVRSIDLAVIHLQEPLPVIFVPVSLSSAMPRTGDRVTIGGYGLTNEMKSTSNGKFFAAELSVIEPYGRSEILLWLSQSPKDSSVHTLQGGCHGDSGGPLFFQNDLVGILTWTTGPKGRDCGDLTQGALIAPQLDWIKTVMR